MVDQSLSPRTSDLPTGIVHSDLFVHHETGAGHPECPERYTAIVDALQQAEFADRLKWITPRAADNDELVACHRGQYVQMAHREIETGMSCLSSGDTAVSEGSWDAALYAAGGACVAVDQLIAGELKNAYCVLRPPGHHATPDRGMGFCVFNNAALATRYAQQKHGIGRVLIVDWDVHHGNGTQNIFYEDDSVFFYSTHQWPWYPGTGARDETGRGKGLGTTKNRPFRAGSARDEILNAFVGDLPDILENFKPELIVISAGFDSRDGDPLGGFHLVDEDFSDLTKLMLEIADDHAGSRLLSVLEGGYDLQGLAAASLAHCRALVEHGRRPNT